MNEKSLRMPPTAHVIAGGLVALGVLLWMLVGKQYLFVAGVGAFGPGLLRELGWLRDQDEFERQAAHRAGYHAYIAGGIATTVVVSLLHWTGEEPRYPADVITWVLVVMWLTWLFSSTMGIWGARRTTAAILSTFGAFWAVFVIADAIGEADSAGELWLGLGIGTLIVAPFFALAYVAHRWPGRAGFLLILVSVGFTVMFMGPSQLPLTSQLFTFTTLILPLLICGIALVREGTRERKAATPLP